MATILAYTSPALGHVLPISALLSELSGRGHGVHLRTLSAGVEIGRRLGFTTDTIDPRIEGSNTTTGRPPTRGRAASRAFATFGRRAAHEVADLRDAIARVHPDALLIDVKCWGALSAAEAGDIPGRLSAVHAAAARRRGAPVRSGPQAVAESLRPRS